MKVAVFAVLPAAALCADELCNELRARGHDAVQRHLPAFDGQSEGADIYLLALSAAQVKSHEALVERFVDIFDHKARPVRLVEVDPEEEGGRPTYEIEDAEELFEQFGAAAEAPVEKLSKLQARAIQLGVPFDASTSPEELAEAIEDAAGQGGGDDEGDEDQELEEQQQLRQRLEALSDDDIRKVAEDEYGHKFPKNAKTETMITKLVALEGEKHDEQQS